MSEHITGLCRNQGVLFPSMIDDYVDKENPVRFIDAFIDSLNLEKLEFKHSVLADTGRHLMILQTCSNSTFTDTSIK